MSAQRKAIRHAMKAMLIAAGTAAGERVFTNRGHALNEQQLPAIVIVNGGEQIEEHTKAPLEYEREAEIRVEIYVRREDTADDDLDDLADEVEQAIFFDESVECTVEKVRLTGVSETVVEADANVDTAAIALTYTATYFTAQPDAEGLFDLEHVHAEYETGGGDNEVPEAVDDIAIPTT
ncbi:MAG: hypothetical protein GY711_11380 [bacterium]|nr:hypothetical protein [bacterium]